MPLAIPEAVERVEAAMRVMPEHLSQVVIACYLERGTDETRAKALGISHAVWKLRLNCGHHWLAGRLSR